MRVGNAWWWVFAIAFVVIALAESVLPARAVSSSTPKRWISNSILLVTSSLVILFAYQLTGFALACAMKADSRGVLNRLSLGYVWRFCIGFAILDLVAYASHRAFHALGLLWRIHRVHHSETDLDLSTGLRFHPGETLFVQGLFLATIAVVGVPPGAVALFALVVVVQDFFTHANLRIPRGVDRGLRVLIVTPAMHRVHHSEDVTEQNANFSTIFSVWDRVFRTYSYGKDPNADPARCGVVEIADGSKLNAAGLLILPFRRERRSDS
jgi:sterol desaturase/sphingolipid hydroxylase (fatty acid hydroxylase superfamily)